MTHHEIRELEDGTRVYANYHRYKPVAREDRLIGVNRPDDPRAVRFHTKWFIPLEFLADEERVMPLTRPDDQTLDHRVLCRCEVCSRPQATGQWRRRYKRRRDALSQARRKALAGGLRQEK